MTTVDWSIKGPHVANCNCDYGCPCQFAALPTDGTCRGVLAWRIDEGHFGDVRLDGLLAVNTYSWPGPIHEGNGDMQSIVDERADAAQRQALTAILKGEGSEPGSNMIQIYRAMCTTVHEPLIARIELDLDVGSRAARLSVPGIIETAVESLRNQVTNEEHRAQIGLPNGKEFNVAEVASGTTRAKGAVPLELQASHAHMVEYAMTSTGRE